MRRPRWLVVQCALALIGLLLVAVYFIHELTLRRTPAEFAYLPITYEPLPYAAMRGFSYEQLWNHVHRFVLLTPALLLLSWLATSLSRSRGVPKLGLCRSALWLSALAVAVLAAIMLLVLRTRVIVDDELVY